MKINLFIYYGTEINKVDYENLTKKLGVHTLFADIFKVGLSIRDVGVIGESWRFIVGKEINWTLNSVTNFNFINNELYVDGNKIQIEDEDEVRRKLISIGITNQPSYKIFSSIEMT